MRLDIYSDPGHGWCAVPLVWLVRLSLLDKITTYSYIRGRFAYLEEDCDFSTFLAAAKDAGIALTFRERVCGDRYSRIRGYDYYTAARARAALADVMEGVAA
jgi:hypothetical protein